MSRYPWRDTSEDIASEVPSQWETPAGAQAKADAALQQANTYTDNKHQEFIDHKNNQVVHVTQADHDKLNGIEAGANKYIHPATHPPSIIAQDSSNRFVSDAQVTIWNGKASTDLVTDTTKGLMSPELKVKVDGIATGAEVNQNAFSKVNNIDAGNKTDTLTFKGSTGISVTTNPATKEVTITATGDATPGPHAETHLTGGSDPIPIATTTGSGLMSPQNVKELDDLKSFAERKNYAQTSGAANVYTVTITDLTYIEGTTIRLKINVTNTGASTINVNSLGAKQLLNSKGADLTAGKLVKDGVYTFIYNGTAFILQGEGGEYGNATANDVLAGKTIGTETGIVTGTMPNNGVKTINPSTADQALNGYYQTGSVVKAVGGNAGALQVLSGHVFSSANGINQTGTMPNNGGVGGQVTQQGQTAWIPAGYTSGGSVTANISNLTAGNILAGVNVGGVVGTGVNGKRFAYTAVTNPDKYNGKFYHELRGLPFKPDIVVGRYYNYFAQLQSEALGGRPNSLCFMWSLYTPDGDKMQKGSASTSPDFALYIDGYKILLCDYQKESYGDRTWHVFAFE